MKNAQRNNFYVSVCVTIVIGMTTIMNNTKQIVFNTRLTKYSIQIGKMTLNMQIHNIYI